MKRLPGVAAVLLLLATGGFFSFRVSSETPVPSETREAKPPNILFAIADDASFPHMGAYGTTWINTPGFDRVAREGILFMNAYTPNAKCAPSRACILTGRNSWQLEEAANHSPHFPARYKTFMEALGENGYFTGHTVKGWAPGDPGTANGQRRLLTGKAYNARTLQPPTAHISKTDYAENFRDFLRERPAGKPFCFWYGSIEPHRRYEYGAGIAKGGKNPAAIPAVPAYWPDTDTVRTDMLDYAYELEYFDRHLQKMIELLAEQGELENTIIVVTADNGMPFPRAKGQAYEISNHLPLAIMWPKGIRNPGRKVTDYVSFIDLAPTFMQLAGLDIRKAGMQPVTGESLAPVFASPKAGRVLARRDHVLIGKERHDVGRPHDQGYPIRGIVRENYLYLRNYEPSRWPAGNPETGYLNTDGGATKTLILNRRRSHPGPYPFWEMSFGKREGEELYDIAKDPDCVTNLAALPELAARKEGLRRQMERELTAQGDPRLAGKGHVFDEYEYAGDVRNFYERYLRGEDVKAGWVEETDFEKTPPGGQPAGQ